MKKLIQGIADFRKHRLKEYREKFSKLALGQSPDTLFIACSDSRVVPNLFASTDPGDLFVLRNIGNFVPPCCTEGHSESDNSVWAAIEFSLMQINISDIVVCGHSECGAIRAILDGREKIPGAHLRSWLEYGDGAASRVQKIKFTDSNLAPHNQVSQANVLLQIEHLQTYPLVQQKLASKELKIHGWWFDIGSGNVHFFDENTNEFLLIAE